MEGMELSHQLLNAGFFCALGTTEHPGMDPEGVIVKKGAPFTFDYNNGVSVVYDEAGRPWITAEPETRIQYDRAMHQLTRGAYVPHSNDGGHFVREILPNLWPRIALASFHHFGGGACRGFFFSKDERAGKER